MEKKKKKLIKLKSKFRQAHSKYLQEENENQPITLALNNRYNKADYLIF